jgi:hypothetical protein
MRPSTGKPPKPYGRQIDHDWRAAVDEVRGFRNAIVHEVGFARESAVVSLAESKRRLCRYFSRLPPDW